MRGSKIFTLTPYQVRGRLYASPVEGEGLLLFNERSPWNRSSVVTDYFVGVGAGLTFSVTAWVNFAPAVSFMTTVKL